MQLGLEYAVLPARPLFLKASIGTALFYAILGGGGSFHWSQELIALIKGSKLLLAFQCGVLISVYNGKAQFDFLFIL